MASSQVEVIPLLVDINNFTNTLFPGGPYLRLPAMGYVRSLRWAVCVCRVRGTWELGDPRSCGVVLVGSAGCRLVVRDILTHRVLSRGLVARALSLCVFYVYDNLCLWHGEMHALVR